MSFFLKRNAFETVHAHVNKNYAQNKVKMNICIIGKKYTLFHCLRKIIFIFLNIQQLSIL